MVRAKTSPSRPWTRPIEYVPPTTTEIRGAEVLAQQRMASRSAWNRQDAMEVETDDKPNEYCWSAVDNLNDDDRMCDCAVVTLDADEWSATGTPDECCDAPLTWSPSVLLRELTPTLSGSNDCADAVLDALTDFLRPRLASALANCQRRDGKFVNSFDVELACGADLRAALGEA